MSDYYCACDPAESEQWTPLTEEWRTARKEHKCCECLETIKRGEAYHYDSGRFDGEFHAYKTCFFCENEREQLNRKTGWCIAFGDLACCLVAHLRGEL